MSNQTTPQFSFSGLTLEQVNIILAGLRELPAKLSYDLINAITQSAQKQIEAANAPAAVESVAAVA